MVLCGLAKNRVNTSGNAKNNPLRHQNKGGPINLLLNPRKLALVLTFQEYFDKELQKMSKEKINPGESCPFCLAATNPGSSVCISCGASRAYSLGGLTTLMLSALGIIGTIAVLCALLTASFGESLGGAFAIFMIVPFCVYTGMYLYKKGGEYIWQRKE